ncbi:UDP-2,4-diacetamido-2,4,6-trideoxy-beta-L-altropyranose hydrolase [Metabacillus arenae]|uniref:UDP-2,4-diacetamido-2,4, 6-trideoxy-beta-L-altropyranose hydrolase n=1 Tax=Metabacillus arenae TaxID=2771434 RepID=A0A926NIY0_9BACI|nr:UDP-2,4-diacetamido-2,4,6-trideoxy-beta-L-altropyranose hydrolase [Metabacillus arenae]MBD1381925.1 UDP-2,4-diacetamido-2,4,6-trideoxy-beta-L-altropyranose hydrolase [Metabacillus arenae]
MNICIRVDASLKIGTGHVMRCLTLADQLKQTDSSISFICREHEGNLNDMIESKGYKVYRLPNDQKLNDNSWLGIPWEVDADQTMSIISKQIGFVDWLIVDHYKIDIKWETKLYAAAKKIMIIDDLADRQHVCDIILDQNFYHDMAARYQSLIPNETKRLFGPKYALLRQEFIEERKKIRYRKGELRRILVFFGGTDPTNETEKVLECIKMFKRKDLLFDVIVGNTNPRKDHLKVLSDKLPNSKFHCQINNMAALMNKADFSFGAGGSTTWERCYLGLPSCVTIIADNQIEVTKAMELQGCIINLGRSQNVTTYHYMELINKMTSKDLVQMSDNCLSLMEGCGSFIISNIISSYSSRGI